MTRPAAHRPAVAGLATPHGARASRGAKVGRGAKVVRGAKVRRGAKVGRAKVGRAKVAGAKATRAGATKVSRRVRRPARPAELAPDGDLVSAVDAVELRARMPAGTGLRHALRELSAAIRVQERGVRLGLGALPVHDFRVAVRQARCVLCQPRHVFRRRDVKHWRNGLHELQRRTDALRNVDSLCERLADEPSHAGNALDHGRLLARLQKRQAAERRTLLAHLRSPAHRALLDGLQAFLDLPAPRAARGRRAERSLVEVVGRRAVRLHRRLLKRRGKVDAKSSPDALHSLRKLAKKLRDLLHVTAPAFGAERLRPLLEALEKLLDDLGVVQDARVHLELIRRAPHDEMLAHAIEAKARKARRRQERRLAALGKRPLRRLVKRLAKAERARPSRR
jgi:CHAD domain-containing protein